jgi:hypothetical protein
MKSFKIKKRENRIIPYIAGDPVSSFKKPVFPFRFLSKINCPNLNRLQNFTFEEAHQQQEPQVQQEQQQEQQERLVQQPQGDLLLLPSVEPLVSQENFSLSLDSQDSAC